MSTELYQQVDPEEVGVSSAYLGNVDKLQERYLAENAFQGSVVLVARHGRREGLEDVLWCLLNAKEFLLRR